MGTHPIFESDFDCLTECYESLREPFLLRLHAEWTQFRPSLSARSNSMLPELLPKVSLMLVLDTPKKVLTSKSVLRVLMEVETWTNSQKCPSPHQILPKMLLRANEQLIS